MPTFRTKPVTVTAIQWDGTYESVAAIRKMAHPQRILEMGNTLTIPTLGCEMRAVLGDWIVRDASAVYPCKPDVFAATCEEV